jgi:hypothetical protein
MPGPGQREIAPGILGSAVAWDEMASISVTADQALLGVGVQPSTKGDAVELLLDVLSGGPMDVREIERHAAIATLLKRQAAGVHQRAHILEIRLARPLPRAEAEVEMICPDTNPPDSTTSIGSVGPLAAREPLKLLILPRQGLPP